VDTDSLYSQPPAPDDSVGQGLLGCIGGILAGLLGGGVLLVGISLALALLALVPAASQTGTGSDLRVTIGEASLNKFAQESAGGSVELDILPGNQVSFKTDTTVTAFGVAVPVQITGLFGLQITAQSTLEVRLIKAEVAGFDLPQERLADAFNGPVATLNQNLSQMVKTASTILGMPLILTGLGTTDTELWLEASTS
jgi:hypothetical protein